MNIQVPWKARLRNGRPEHRGRDFWIRRKYHDDLDVAKRPDFLVEDDLDHLGMVHKNQH